MRHAYSEQCMSKLEQVRVLELNGYGCESAIVRRAMVLESIKAAVGLLAFLVIGVLLYGALV